MYVMPFLYATDAVVCVRKILLSAEDQQQWFTEALVASWGEQRGQGGGGISCEALKVLTMCYLWRACVRACVLQGVPIPPPSARCFIEYASVDTRPGECVYARRRLCVYLHADAYVFV